MSLADLIATLRAKIGFILLCALICGLCAAFYALFRKPAYEASATLRIDSTRAGSLGVSDPSAPAIPDDSEIIRTEMGVMKSDTVALRVLNSLSDNDFYRATGFHKEAAAMPSSASSLTLPQTDLLNSFERDTKVTQVDGTQLVSVGVTNQDPHLAAALANDVVAAYQVQSIASRDISVAQLRASLTDQIRTLRNQVDASQQKLAAFEEANSVLGTQGSSNTVEDRLKLLNDHLAQADADRIAKEGQYRAAESGSPSTLTSLFQSPKLNELQSQQGLLLTKYAQLSAKFDQNYPPLAELKRQLDTISSQISANAEEVRNGLKQQYEAADNVEKMFQREYDQQTAAAFALNRNQAEYARLAAEVTAGRELADALQRKLDLAVVDAEVSGVNVMMMDAARPPARSSGPGKLLIVICGLLIGLFAGVATVFASEAISNTQSKTYIADELVQRDPLESDGLRS